MRLIPMILMVFICCNFVQCSKETGCPGVKSYTERSSQGSKKSKGKAPWNKRSASKKKGEGLAPWTKKAKKKDDKKASSGLYSKEVKKKSKQVED